MEISWGSLWRIAVFSVFAIVIYLGHQIVLGLFLAIVISSGFEGMIDSIERRLRVPRSLGVVLVFLDRDPSRRAHFLRSFAVRDRRAEHDRDHRRKIIGYDHGKLGVASEPADLAVGKQFHQ